MSVDENKLRAARAALDHLPEHGVIGLGSGSTATLFIQAVGELVAAGRQFRGVPTSQQSRTVGEECGIPMLEDAGPWDVDVCVDGADEVSARLDLIKGGGACHAREKIVNDASRVNIIVVDESKLSDSLGEKWRIPVEVQRFGHRRTEAILKRFGDPELRLAEGEPVVTDGSNYIYDLQAGVIDDPATLDAQLQALPGVVETGLFVARADLILIAGSAGIRELRR